MADENDFLRVLTDLEAVRARPDMYIGTTGPKALWELVKMVLDFCVGTDGPIPSGAKQVEIALYSDGGVCIRDDGQGLSVEASGRMGREDEPWVMVALTTVWVPGGFPGAGLGIVNGLSSEMVVSVERDGHSYLARFSNGEPEGPLERVSDHRTIIGFTIPDGTSISFWPRTDVFTEGFDRGFFDEQLVAYSTEHPDVTFQVIDCDPAGLDTAIADATQVVVEFHGVFPQPAAVALRVTDPGDVDEFRRLLVIEGVSDGHCMCAGDLLIKWFDRAGEPLAAATLHHGTHLRWQGWSGDGWLLDSQKVVGWLTAHGVPDMEAMRMDTTRYSVCLDRCDAPGAGLIRLIHQTLEVGVTRAREMIRTGDVVLFEGSAVQVFKSRGDVEAAGFGFHVVPEFRY